MSESPEIIHMSTVTTKLVTWPKAFGGVGGKLEITQAKRAVFVTLSGCGMDSGWRIAEVPVSVLREILAMVDALPRVVDAPEASHE